MNELVEWLPAAGFCRRLSLGRVAEGNAFDIGTVGEAEHFGGRPR